MTRCRWNKRWERQIKQEVEKKLRDKTKAETKRSIRIIKKRIQLFIHEYMDGKNPLFTVAVISVMEGNTG